MPGYIQGSNQAPLIPHQYDAGQANSVEEARQQGVSAGFQQENTISHISREESVDLQFRPVLEIPSEFSIKPALMSQVKSLQESSRSDMQAIKTMRLVNANSEKLSSELRGRLSNVAFQLLSVEKLPDSDFHTIQQGINSIQKTLMQESFNPAEMDSIFLTLEVAFTNNKSELQGAYQKTFQEQIKHKMETIRKVARFLNHLVDDSRGSGMGKEWSRRNINYIIKSYGLKELSPSGVKELRRLIGMVEGRGTVARNDAALLRKDLIEGAVKLIFAEMDLPLPSNLRVFAENIISSFSKDSDRSSWNAYRGGVEATDKELEDFEGMMREAVEGITLADAYQELAMQYQGEQIRKNLRVQTRI